MLEVPEDRRIAEAYSRGEPLGAAIPSYAGIMRSLLERVRGDESTNQNPEGGFSISRNGALAGKNPDTVLGKLFGVAAEVPVVA